ncbi:hypothetical protein KVF89_22625 [Nocardioides carbamazepini]|uniref:hypothetical protein n=1 Tax=Nocardioides carbamazepini TaxID=2854259 RepID=UPI00214A2597|nr:hypothetical protein [Nocardioides carbamazepini]MCR1785353.1 hypothetical protein [Nocardioides carbamazepini]
MSTPHMRPALDVMAELRAGRLHNEMTEGLHRLITEALQSGRKGTLVLKLTVEPKKVGDYETPRVEISDQVVVTPPRRVSNPSTFYVTEDGAPVRTDPNQQAFKGVRAVPDGAEASDAGGLRDGRSAAANDR